MLHVLLRFQFSLNWCLVIDLSSAAVLIHIYRSSVLRVLQIMHPQADDYFEAFDGFQYLPRARLKAVYPHG